MAGKELSTNNYKGSICNTLNSTWHLEIIFKRMPIILQLYSNNTTSKSCCNTHTKLTKISKSGNVLPHSHGPPEWFGHLHVGCKLRIHTFECKADRECWDYRWEYIQSIIQRWIQWCDNINRLGERPQRPSLGRLNTPLSLALWPSRAFHGKEAIWKLLPSIVYFFFKQTEDAVNGERKAKAVAILGFPSFFSHNGKTFTVTVHSVNIWTSCFKTIYSLNNCMPLSDYQAV